MIPLSLSASCVGPFERLDLQIPAGPLSIVGANGSGKTTLTRMVEVALFGGLRDRLSHGEPACLLELQFEHMGDTYRIRRSYQDGKSPSCDFEVRGAHDIYETWSPLGRETVKATDQLIADTLGLDRPTYLASCVIAAGTDSWTHASPVERKRMLAGILQLDLWDRLRETVREQLAAVKQTLAVVEADILRAQVELVQQDGLILQRDQLELAAIAAGVDVAAAELALADEENRVAGLREQQAALEAARKLADDRIQLLAARTQRIEELASQASRAQTALAEKPKLEQVAGRIGKLETDEQLAVEYDRVRQERIRLGAESSRLSTEMNAVFVKAGEIRQRPDAACPTCKREFTSAEDRAHALAELEEEARRLGEQVDAVEAQLAAMPLPAEHPEPIGNIQHDLRQARAAREQLAALTERETNLRTLEAELAVAREQLPALEQAAKEAQEAVTACTVDDTTPSQVQTLKDTLGQARQRHQVAATDLARCEQKLERLTDLANAQTDALAEREKQQQEIDLLTDLDRAYGPNGIPALILENAIPLIETRAQEILAQLGGKTRSATVQIRTQKQLKTTDRLGETLDIVLYTTEGYEQPLALWSTGERLRIDFALAWGLRSLISAKRGAEPGLLILDDIGGLDSEGKTALVEILAYLQTAGLPCVWVVSQEPELRDAFDRTVELVSDGMRSRIAGVDTEAVAA